MIKSVMSVMEGDKGMDKQNIKNCFYFQMEGRTDFAFISKGREDRF